MKEHNTYVKTLDTVANETNREDVCNFWNIIIQEKHPIGKEKHAIIIENHELKLVTLENEKMIFQKKKDMLIERVAFQHAELLSYHSIRSWIPIDYNTERNYRDLNQYQDNIDFQPVMFNLDKNWMVLRSQSRGDGDIDIFSNYNYYLLLIQCKDYTDKIEVDYIYVFKSGLVRFDKDKTIGIYMISAKGRLYKGFYRKSQFIKMLFVANEYMGFGSGHI
ncbi:15898_t:CDS:2 [Funneliformis geosporum]|nr:15898_t:CDS:2 [Funneliformis geosporum]